MARNKAYRKSEQQIQEALRSKKTAFYLSGVNLTELPESLGQLTQLHSLELARLVAPSKIF